MKSADSRPAVPPPQAGENEGLLQKGASLSLWILPLKKSDLLQDIYLQVLDLRPRSPSLSSFLSPSHMAAPPLQPAQLLCIEF